MAQPTEAQIRQLEAAHKDLLLTIVTACKLWFKLLDKYALLPSNNPDKMAFKKWTFEITSIIGGWFAAQKAYEKAGVSKVLPIKAADFFDKNKLDSLANFFTGFAKSIGYQEDTATHSGA